MDNELKRCQEVYRIRDASGINKVYHYFNPAYLFHMQERERAIISMLSGIRYNLCGKSILEIGCGCGHILQRFKEFGAHYLVGVDIAESRLQSAINRYKNIYFISANGAKLPFKDGSFDMVMQFMCISSILNRSVRVDVCKELSRVLKQDGVILSYDMRPLTSFFTLFNLFNRGDNASNSYTPTRPLGYEEAKKYFPEYTIIRRKVSLEFGLARLSKLHFIIPLFLSIFPILRTHYLFIIRRKRT